VPKITNITGEGPTYDFMLDNKSGNTVFRVPTGTVDSSFFGDVIITSATAGNVGVGVSAFGTSATNVIGITADGTVPSTSPAGMIQIFADDSSDGAANATLALRTEQAVEAIGTFTASHKLKIWINGVEYYIQLDAV